MILFYSPDIDSDPFLPEIESGHCCRVLRMRVGDEIQVTDGKGNKYLCQIIDDNPKRTKVKILNKESIPKSSYTLTLAVAPTKSSDRMEWLVEKAVEIGVDRIVLLRCDRSERKEMRGERLRKVIIAAMKQSLAYRLPELIETVKFKDFVGSIQDENNKFFGYCSDAFPRKDFAKECEPGKNVVIMIGPEGDFSENEVRLAVDSGFIPVTLGQKRLRTETAALYAICAVKVINTIN